MEVKRGYKRTELGVIPAEWGVVALRHLNPFVTSGSRGWAQYYTEYGTPFIRITNLTRESIRLDLSDLKMVSLPPTDQEGLRTCLRPGDLLISITADIGIIGVVDSRVPQPAYINQHIALVRVGSADADPRFLGCFLASRVGQKMFRSGADVGAKAGLNLSGVLSIQTALPPLPEQKAIAEALSDVDDLIASLERLIAKKRDIKAATMGQLLTGRTRLPGFTGEWARKRLGELGICLRGVSYRGDNDLFPYDTPATKRLLRSSNVQDAAIVTADVQFVRASCVSARQVLMRDDILICMANGSKALVGKAGRFKTEDGYAYTFGAFMGCFRTERGLAVPEFVFGLFLTEKYRGYIAQLLAGSSINNLRPSSIASLEFSMPPLPEQAAIAAVLSDMDAEIDALESRLAKTRMLKQGMMQELLTGRTRLV